jgi:hypothetical protein
VTNVNADRLNVVVWLITPHFLEDERGCNGLTVALEQAMQKLKFQMGEPHRMIKPDRLKAFRHQGQWPIAQDFVMISGGSNGSSVASPKERFDAGRRRN